MKEGIADRAIVGVKLGDELGVKLSYSSSPPRILKQITDCEFNRVVGDVGNQINFYVSHEDTPTTCVATTYSEVKETEIIKTSRLHCSTPSSKERLHANSSYLSIISVVS